MDAHAKLGGQSAAAVVRADHGANGLSRAPPTFGFRVSGSSELSYGSADRSLKVVPLPLATFRFELSASYSSAGPACAPIVGKRHGEHGNVSGADRRGVSSST